MKKKVRGGLYALVAILLALLFWSAVFAVYDINRYEKFHVVTELKRYDTGQITETVQRVMPGATVYLDLYKEGYQRSVQIFVDNGEITTTEEVITVFEQLRDLITSDKSFFKTVNRAAPIYIRVKEDITVMITVYTKDRETRYEFCSGAWAIWHGATEWPDDHAVGNRTYWRGKYCWYQEREDELRPLSHSRYFTLDYTSGTANFGFEGVAYPSLQAFALAFNSDPPIIHYTI